jgi:spermidine synthase
LLLLFAASGASGLVYELVWVRHFGTLFGSSVYSAAVVTAIYMCGLGLGAWMAGAWSDRRFRVDPVSPLRWYGRFELGIGGLAALTMPLMPWLARVTARAAGYEAGADGWFWLAPLGSLVRYGCAGILLLPITLLMGGTLTLLIRYVVADDLSRVGRQVGLLYGVNTAGAALGCLVTDTALVPWLGLRATQAIAVGLSVFAAAGAWWLSRAARSPGSGISAPAPDTAVGEVRMAWVAASLALVGFASMAMQIVWFRQLISVFGAFRPVFSLLLTVILVGIWLGSVLGGRLAHRGAAPALYALALAGFVLSALAGLGWLRHGESIFDATSSEPSDAAWRWALLYGRLLGEVSWVVGPPALFAGAAFPLSNAIAQRARERVGLRAGLLYLANTLGGVLGSLVAGFVLLPRLGIQDTVAVLMLGVLAALVGWWRAVGWRALSAPARRLQAASCAAILLALVAWSRLPDQFLVRRSLPLAPSASGRGVLALREGVNETLAILSEPGPALRLLTNGQSMSGTHFAAQRYMRAFVHVPLLLDPGIEKVLVLCFGVGTTASAALLHPQVQRVDVVDLSPDVLAHSPYFAAVNGRPLDDPRVRVYVNDARHHLNMLEGETYDLITGEPPPITQAGVVNLYTREFFELLRSRLRPGGFATYWLPLGHVGEAVARSMVRAFLDAFPGAVLLSGHADELILVGRQQGRIEIDPEAVMRRVRAIPALREDLRGIELATVADLVGMLVATAPTLERATRGVPPLRDDHPILEYGIRPLQSDRRIPSDLASVADVERWCPRCFGGALDEDEERRLRGYLEVIALFYRSEAFLSGRPVSALDGSAALSGDAARAVADHLYLQDLLYRLPRLHHRALHLVRHGRPRLAISSLEELLRADPDNRRAREDLAHLRLRVGDAEAARRGPAGLPDGAPGPSLGAAARGRAGSGGAEPR